MKWSQPPSLPVLRVVNGVIAVLFLWLSIAADNRWLALFYAFMAGVEIGMVLTVSVMIAMRRSLDEMHEAFKGMCDINRALISDKVEINMARSHDRDDDAPIAPKLH